MTYIAGSVRQLEQNVAALTTMSLPTDDLDEIDRYATDVGINLWKTSSDQ